MRRTSTYNSWRAINDRCNCASIDSYKYYGQCGITYCPEWERFEAFLEAMGEKPEGMTLDRIDSNLGYSPENCRWGDAYEQSRNRRNNICVEYNGETRVLSEWAFITGIPYDTLRARIVRLKWPVARAFITPVKAQIEVVLTFGGRTQSTADWSRETGLPNNTIRNRVKALGWPVEQALTTPVIQTKR